MKFFKFTFYLIASLLLAFSCSKSPDVLSEQDKEKITQEIYSIVDNFLSTEITYESHINLRANVEGYVMGSDGAIIADTYKDYTDGVKQAFDGIDKFLFLEPTKKYVYVLAKDAASCTCEFKGKILTVTGDTVVHNGCWTFVFKQMEGEWKVVHENGTHTH